MIYTTITSNLKKAFFLFLITFFVSSYSFSQTVTVPSGSIIVDMGVSPQTFDNGIKPYGLVYTLLDDDNIPVIWAIDQTKVKDGVDFTVDGRPFRGGPFIISAADLTQDVENKIAMWAADGVVTYKTLSSFDVPVYRILDEEPTWAINDNNENIVLNYLDNAGITNPDSGSPEANWIIVHDAADILNNGLCADVFAMPHNDDVTWERYGGLIQLNSDGMWIWAGCKAVSGIENVFNPANNAEKLNFLSTTGLVDADDHDDASGNLPYMAEFHEHQFMQFLGQTDEAHDGGAEQIYLPSNGSAWNTDTKVAAWDTNQDDLGTLSPGKAALIAFGPAFGNENNGNVMYEAGHKLDNGTVQENVAAQRAFFNFSLNAAGSYSGGNRTYAIDDINFTDFDTPVNGNVLTNDKDYDLGDTISLVTILNSNLVTTQGGTINFHISGNGDYTYTPPVGFIGLDTFEYTIEDDAICTAKDKATVSIKVVGPPDCFAVLDAFESCLDTTVVRGTVLANDVDPDIVVNTGILATTAGGLVVMQPDGFFTYTPAFGFEGEDTFEYTMQNNDGLTCTALVTIEVENTCAPPDAVDDFYLGCQDVAITIYNVLDNDSTDSEVPTEAISVDVAVTNALPGPINGTVAINDDGTFTYTPNAGFIGRDWFVYEIVDTGGDRDRATVYLDIGENTTNAIDDINYTAFNTPTNGNVLTNDVDYEGDTQSLTTLLDVDLPTTEGGTINFDISGNGDYDYTPAAGFYGTDTFEYSIVDSRTNCPATDTATLRIVVGRPCFAFADSGKTCINAPTTGNVLINDVNPWGHPVALVTPVGVNLSTTQGGTINFTAPNTNGDFTYTPALDFTGIDTFEYTIVDTITGVECSALVTIKITPFCDIDVRDDFNLGCHDTDITGNVLPNDVPNDPALVSVNVAATDALPGPYNGSVVINADGTYVYTPTPGFIGWDSFVYESYLISDPTIWDRATVYLYVYNNITYAIDDINYTLVDTPIDGNVLTNDSDIEGDTQVVTTTTVTSVEGVVVTIDANTGEYSYDPPTGFVGTDTFEYSIFDSRVSCPAIDNATVFINVKRPDECIAMADPFESCLNTTVVRGSVLANDIDPDFVVTTGNIVTTMGGLAVMQADGFFTYTPAVGFEGEDSFAYTMQNIDGLTCIAPVTIEVENTCEPPDAVDDFYIGCQDEDITENVLLNDSTDNEVPTETISVDVAATNALPGPFNGSLIINTNGDFTYIPNAGYSGADYFVYEIVDTGGDRDRATVYFYILDPSTIAGINIEKTGVWIDSNQNQCADVGDMIDYTFTVTNTGIVSLYNVIVDDPLLGGPVVGPVSGDANGNTELDITETWIYTGQYAITQIDINAGVVNNTAVASGQEPVCDTTVMDTSNAVSTELNACPGTIEIVKTGVYNGGECAVPGDTIDYTFVVTNTGDVTLTDVLVTDPLVTVLGGPIVLTPGQVDTATFTATYTIILADITAGMVDNIATVTGIDPGGVIVTDDSNTVSTMLPTNCGKIALIKEGFYDATNEEGECDIEVGDLINYTFSVKNTGNVFLTNVMVTDLNPLVTVIGGPITLAPGEENTTTFTGTYAITNADIVATEFVNQAEAVGTPPTGSDVTDLSDDTSYLEDDPTVTPISCAKIALIKVGFYDGTDEQGNCIAAVGDEILYTFSVKNTGNIDLTNVMVTDPLLTIVVGGPIDLIVGQEDTTTFTGTYLITQVDIDLGVFINQAEATGTPPTGSDVSDLSDDNNYTENDPTITVICEPEDDPYSEISLIKIGTYENTDENGDCIFDSEVGDVLTYNFSVKNTGDETLTNVMVTDLNPLVTVIGEPITLLPGEEDITTFTGTYTITQADIDALMFENQAEVIGTNPAGDNVSDLSDDDSYFEDDPTITLLCSILKMGLVMEGQVIYGQPLVPIDCAVALDYTYWVSNEGNVTITDIVLDHPDVGGVLVGPDSGDDINPGILDVGEIWIYTSSYVVTEEDLIAGIVITQSIGSGLGPDMDGDGNDDAISDLSDDDSPLEDDPTELILCRNGIALLKVGTLIDDDGDGCGAEVGETISYAFTVVNTGFQSLWGLTVTDPLVTVTGGPIDLAIGLEDTTTFTAMYTITQDDIDAGMVENQARVDGFEGAPDGQAVFDLSDFDTLDLDRPTITILDCGPSIGIIKTVELEDENEDGCPDVGETLNYSFSVKNTGTQVLTNVMVFDNLLPGLVLEGGPIATLAAGEEDTTTFTATYVITIPDIETLGQIDNQATAEGTTTEGEVVSDLSDNDSYLEDDITTIFLCVNPLSFQPVLVKGGKWIDEIEVNTGEVNGAADVGELIEYTFTITNPKPYTIYNITLEDIMLPGLILEGGSIESLEPNETDSTTFRGYYFITAEDLDVEAGELAKVVNQAKVTAWNEEGTLSGDRLSDSDDPELIGEFDPTVVILPIVDPKEWEIFNGVTPNDDSYNDYFKIKGIQDYPDNNVKIYNRWGILIWETNGYEYSENNTPANVFTGDADARMLIEGDKDAPTGTYFYIITIFGDGPFPDDRRNFSGYLYLNR